MASFQVGDVILCPDCGLELTVTKACNCEKECVIKCCDTPLEVRRDSGDQKPGGGCCCCSG
ncbi:hypothetical protein JXB37_06280 [candidate division WOR-3 bacterium]|nr:hypothetical protein [candidate division WOR-3 bacterium]